MLGAGWDERELSCGASRGLGIRDAPRGCNQLVQCKEPQRQSKGKGTTETCVHGSRFLVISTGAKGVWSCQSGLRIWNRQHSCSTARVTSSICLQQAFWTKEDFSLLPKTNLGLLARSRDTLWHHWKLCLWGWMRRPSLASHRGCVFPGLIQFFLVFLKGNSSGSSFKPFHVVLYGHFPT